MNKIDLTFRQEITVWGDDTPNHTYVFQNKKLVGYVPVGKTVVRWFKQPSVQWSPRGRKFRYLNQNEINALTV